MTNQIKAAPPIQVGTKGYRQDDGVEMQRVRSFFKNVLADIAKVALPEVPFTELAAISSKLMGGTAGTTPAQLEKEKVSDDTRNWLRLVYSERRDTPQTYNHLFNDALAVGQGLVKSNLVRYPNATTFEQAIADRKNSPWERKDSDESLFVDEFLEFREVTRPDPAGRPTRFSSDFELKVLAFLAEEKKRGPSGASK